MKERGSYRKRAHFFTILRRFRDRRKAAFPPQVGYTRDISAKGLYFYTKYGLNQGDNISLTIYPNGEWAKEGLLPKLEVEGKILRVECAGETSGFSGLSGVAVRFTRKPALSLAETETGISSLRSESTA